MAWAAGVPYRRGMPESDPVHDEIHAILSQPLPPIVESSIAELLVP